MIGVFALAFLNVVYQLMTSDGLPFGAFGLIFAVGLLYIVPGLLWEAKTGRKLPRGTAGMGGMGPAQGLQDTIDSGSSDGSGGSN